MRYAARELKGGEVGESMERVSWPPCSWMPAMILETSASWDEAAEVSRGWRCSPSATVVATETFGRRQWENKVGNRSARHGPGNHLSFQRAVEEPSARATLVMERYNGRQSATILSRKDGDADASPKSWEEW
jgi:hypothetical protein